MPTYRVIGPEDTDIQFFSPNAKIALPDALECVGAEVVNEGCIFYLIDGENEFYTLSAINKPEALKESIGRLRLKVYQIDEKDLSESEEEEQ